MQEASAEEERRIRKLRKAEKSARRANTVMAIEPASATTSEEETREIMGGTSNNQREQKRRKERPGEESGVEEIGKITPFGQLEGDGEVEIGRTKKKRRKYE